MTVLNPFLSQFFNRIMIQTKAGRCREFVPRQPTSYACQRDAVVESLRDKTVLPTGGEEGIKAMTVIDEIYSAAGLSRRGERSK